MSVDEVMKQAMYDKHYELKRVTMGLLDRVGAMHEVDGQFTMIVEPEILRRALEVNIEKRESNVVTAMSEADRNLSCVSLCSLFSEGGLKSGSSGDDSESTGSDLDDDSLESIESSTADLEGVELPEACSCHHHGLKTSISMADLEGFTILNASS